MSPRPFTLFGIVSSEWKVGGLPYSPLSGSAQTKVGHPLRVAGNTTDLGRGSPHLAGPTQQLCAEGGQRHIS